MGLIILLAMIMGYFLIDGAIDALRDVAVAKYESQTPYCDCEDDETV